MVTLKDIQKNLYMVDIADDILAMMIGLKTNAGILDSNNKQLQEEIDNLHYEMRLIYRQTGTKEEQDNAYLKVFNEYGELLKSENHGTTAV